MRADSSFPQTHISVFICLGLLGAAIVFANAAVIFLYRRKAFLKTKTNLCLACLALSDMLAGAIAVPMVISCNLAEVDMVTELKICAAMDLSSRFISISTVLHLLLVTAEIFYDNSRHALSIHRYKVSIENSLGVYLVFLAGNLAHSTRVDSF